jgi:hypothetical protein
MSNEVREILSDQQIVNNASHLMVEIALINTKVDVLHPGNIGSAATLPVFGKANSNESVYWNLIVEYGGFCPHQLCKDEALVVPGDWNLGILRYKEKLYAFSSTIAAKEWSYDPEFYIKKITTEISRKHPDLIQLLHVRRIFYNLASSFYTANRRCGNSQIQGKKSFT